MKKKKAELPPPLREHQTRMRKRKRRMLAVRIVIALAWLALVGALIWTVQP